jgi:hypothetical protein
MIYFLTMFVAGNIWGVESTQKDVIASKLLNWVQYEIKNIEEREDIENDDNSPERYLLFCALIITKSRLEDNEEFIKLENEPIYQKIQYLLNYCEETAVKYPSRQIIWRINSLKEELLGKKAFLDQLIAPAKKDRIVQGSEDNEEEYKKRFLSKKDLG